MLYLQGKLVAQNSHDEPASELLKRIHREKAQLIKEGKIKREMRLCLIENYSWFHAGFRYKIFERSQTKAHKGKIYFSHLS